MNARVLPDPFPPACATAWGDDSYGLWSEITVKGVGQRLRWIEPGTFWMGSTDAERELFAAGDEEWLAMVRDEAPRHSVRLTQGVWMADTTCTQELWQAVTGKSPSRFKGQPFMPVEQVSWDDVTMKFLPMLKSFLAEAEVFLPTEAQWEFACRAGTNSAYNFGETITKDQVNFGSNRPVSVKALPANRWGLYQMHGNVWEWCADARRSYTHEGMTDPDGGQGGSNRILRGGSWSSESRKARCAFRLVNLRDLRLDFIGFRFALRSVET